MKYVKKETPHGNARVVNGDNTIGIPKYLRDKLDIRPGDEIAFEPKDNDNFLMTVKRFRR